MVELRWEESASAACAAGFLYYINPFVRGWDISVWGATVKGLGIADTSVWDIISFLTTEY